MLTISLRELHWQDYLILVICLSLIIINLGMTALFMKKYSEKKSTMQFVLGLFQLVSAYVALDYGLHSAITINEVWDSIIEDAFIIGIIVLPLLLIRIAGEMCKSKPSLIIEVIFFGTKLACFIPVLLLPVNTFVSYLVFLPMAIMLAFVLYFLIYKPHKVKKELDIDDHVLKVALDIVGVSAVLFIIVLFMFAIYASFHLYAIIISAFILYFAFLVTVYLGYYNPIWWRRIISQKGDFKYCYGEFDECLNLIEEEDKQDKRMKELEEELEHQDQRNIEDIEELDDMEELKDLIEGLENLKELGDIQPEEDLDPSD